MGSQYNFFFHHFQGQTSDNELLHWMMMMLGSAAFVIVGICFVKKGGENIPFILTSAIKHMFLGFMVLSTDLGSLIGNF